MPAGGAINQTSLPDDIGYDAANRRLLVGDGFVENVSPEMWHYQVSGKQVLRQWFSYRRANRERPIIGDRRPPSKLGDIQPDHWLAEYTSELTNLLHVLGWLVALEPDQATLLDYICTTPTLSTAMLHEAGALGTGETTARTSAGDVALQIRLIE